MLNPSALLVLLQSFLRQRLSSSFPDAWIPEDKFSSKRPSEVCDEDTWAAATADLKKMLCLCGGNFRGNTKIGSWCKEIWSEWGTGKKELAFMTSGSTGVPKTCIHTLEDLHEEALFLKTLLGDRKYFVSAVSPHHLYGFTFGLYLPHILDVECIHIPPFPHIFRAKVGKHGTGVGFPGLYERFDSNVAGVGSMISASAPLAPECMCQLMDMGYEVVDIFGSSETGVLGIRKSPDAFYELLPYYEKVNDRTVQRDMRIIKLMDTLEWRGGREFIPIGRIDSMVQVEGMNVSPMNVAAKIQKCDFISDCTVRLMRPEEGHRLKAFVVPANGCSAKDTLFALREFLNTLFPEERPVAITIGDALPRNPIGKLCDW